MCAASAAAIAIAIARVSKGQVYDAKASLSAQLLPLTRTATAAAIAITRASKGQVMMPRHHCLPCHCCQRAQASTAAAAIAIVGESEE